MKKIVVFHLLNQGTKFHSWLNCAPCTIHTTILVVLKQFLYYRTYNFGEIQPQRCSTDLLGPKIALVIAADSRSSYLIQSFTRTQSELQSSSEPSKCAESGQQTLKLAFLSLPSFSNFPTSLHPFREALITPIQQEEAMKSFQHNSRGLGVW